MVSSLPLPTPDPTSDVWGDDLNAAINAVNNDLEATKAIQAGKADSSAVTAALALKADTSTVTGLATQIAAKANSTDVNSALALKADVSALATKADQTEVDVLSGAIDSAVASIDGKADQTEVDSALALKADETDLTALSGVVATKVDQTDFNALEGLIEGFDPASLFLDEGDLIPAGTPARTVIYRSQSYPEDVKVTHVSNNDSQPISDFELPDDLAVGDVVLAVAVTVGAGRTYTWAAPWTEIFDYSQQRTISAAIYRIVDEAALQAIVVPTITPSGNFDSMVLATLKIEAQNAAWPAYSSGAGRSAATLISPTTTGFSINTINSSPFASFDTEYVLAAAYSGILSGPAPDVSLPGTFEILVDASTGGLAFVVGKRSVSTVPVAAVAVGVAHPAGFGNANHGGAQFIVPAKEA